MRRLLFPAAVSLSLVALVACSSDDEAGSPPGASSPAPSPTGPSSSGGPPGSTPPGAPAAPGGVDTGCLTGGYAALDFEVSAIVPDGDGAALVSNGKLVPIADGKLGAPKNTAPFANQASELVVARGGDGSLLVVTAAGVVVVDQAGKITRDLRKDALRIPVSAATFGKDGAIYTVGKEDDAQQKGQLVVSRIGADGKIDPTFGVQGRAKTTSQDDLGSARRIVAADDGTLWILASGGFFAPAVARVSPTGTFDVGFGTSGVVVLKQLGPRNARDFALTKDGGAFVLGMTNDQPQIAKVLPSGTLDTAFATAGVATFSITKPLSSKYDEQVESTSLVLQPDGKLLVVSSYEWDDGEDKKLEEESILVLRANADGKLDESFGTKGVTRVALGSVSKPSKVWASQSSVVVGGNRLLVGGTTYSALGTKGPQAGGVVCLAL